MALELTMNILNGEAFTLDTTNIETVEQLKCMLRKKFCDDPIGQKILKVQVLKDLELLKDSRNIKNSMN